jgi:hypothetical protein
MKRLKSWLELIAQLGVVAGLLFLALELKQNTALMRAQTRSEVTQSILDIIASGRHPGVVQANLRRESGDTLSAEDWYFLKNQANATLRLWENTYYQYTAGLFDDAEFQADQEVWRELMQLPEYKELWLETGKQYSQGFRQELDQLVSESR